MAVISSAIPRPGARPPVCILDARLLLEPLGLLLACRLSRQVETWLVRRLWSLLDNDAFYQSWPDELAPECTQEHARRLGAWRTAWLDGQLNQRFFWVGDARYESALPFDFDASFRERFERLAIELDPPTDEAGAPPCCVLDQCARDGLALAGALANDNPLILTSYARTPSTPHLVSLAQRFAPFKVAAAGPDASLLPDYVRRIVAPMVPFGMRLAAVHVIAPDAAIVPLEPLTQDAWESRAEGCSSLWSGAGLVWQAFPPGETTP